MNQAYETKCIFYTPQNHLSRTYPQRLIMCAYLNKAPLQAGHRYILPTGSFISLIANLQLIEDSWSTGKTGTARGLGLGGHRAWRPQGLAPSPSPFPHPQRALSPVLLWQTSLGGTVRQCSCPCQGKQYPLSPPTSVNF